VSVNVSERSQAKFHDGLRTAFRLSHELFPRGAIEPAGARPRARTGTRRITSRIFQKKP
jgi:hypothetical protein